MREILFRGKCTTSDNWVEGYFHLGSFSQVSIITGYYDEFPVMPATVSEFTGLTDKNGKRIFEGDIVKATFDDDDEFTAGGEGIGAVCFAYGQWYVCGDLQRSLHDLNCEYYIKIIGNIHDNPEMREAK